MAKFIHDMGMPLDEAVSEFERILFGLDFEIEGKVEIDNGVEIKALKDGERLKLIFKPHKTRFLGIQRTIVEIYCTKSLHEVIHERIRRLRCGG